MKYKLLGFLHINANYFLDIILFFLRRYKILQYANESDTYINRRDAKIYFSTSSLLHQNDQIRKLRRIYKKRVI